MKQRAYFHYKSWFTFIMQITLILLICNVWSEYLCIYINIYVYCVCISFVFDIILCSTSFTNGICTVFLICFYIILSVMLVLIFKLLCNVYNQHLKRYICSSYFNYFHHLRSLPIHIIFISTFSRVFWKCCSIWFLQCTCYRNAIIY